MNKSKKNHLKDSTSPYLLQHINNPVDWYPWGEEALTKAKQEDKPILLSIGYSACHWCHVMAHESFEDEETAKLMNELFVNIKVDREERPDLDKIYQTAHQILAQRPGGWPLTVFLTPDKQIPFFAGTYFPPRAGFGRASFKEILKFIADSYRNRKDEIAKQNASLMQIFKRIAPQPTKQTLNLSPIEKAIANITENFDKINGGFGDAPKFPQTNYLGLLLRQYVITRNDSLLEIVRYTLEKMANSGLYDQLGGGFFRYSVDAEWQIPHFEKMLYDNAQLLTVYVQAYALTNNDLFAEVASGIAAWVSREMQAAEGGYFSTLDADSEGQEGRFYIWSKEEIAENLTAQEYSIIAAYYGLNQPPNFEEHYHLHVVSGIPELSEKFNLSVQEIKKIIATAKQKLFQVRKQRIYPHRDEKILTAWNGLMLNGMAMASTYLSREDFLVSAKKSLEFIYKNMWRNEQLMASYKDNKTTIKGYLDDYVFLIDGIMTFLQAQWQTGYSDFMLKLIETLLQQFQDNDAGGFFFTPHEHETLLYRPKNIVDEAIPSGNGIAALVLIRLGYLTGETRYITAAENTLKMAWESIEHYPDACVSLLFALQEFLNPPEIIIIRGKKEELSEWQKTCREKLSPLQLALAIAAEIKDLPAYLREKKPQEKTVAYICKGFECLSPMTDISKL